MRLGEDKDRHTRGWTNNPFQIDGDPAEDGQTCSV
jgi:hypothetical protein